MVPSQPFVKKMDGHPVLKWFSPQFAGTLDNGFHGFRGGLRRKWHRRSGQGDRPGVDNRGVEGWLVSMKEMAGFIGLDLVEGAVPFLYFVTW